MKSALLPLATLLALAVAPASSEPANAAESFVAPGTQVQATQPTDISARRKKRQAYRQYRGWYEPNYAWHAGDPTAGPNSLYNYYRRNNICAIDEGYGRATRCD